MQDFPVIDMPEQATAPAAPAPAPVASAALPAVVSMKDAALAQFSATERDLIALADRYRDVAYDVSIPRVMSAAKLARQEIRESRYAVQRVEKSTLAELNDLKRTVSGEAARLIAIIEPVEEGVHAQIKAHEDKIAAEKAERERIENERVAKHAENIAAIRAYFTRCAGLTSERIAKGIDMLDATALDPQAWQEFHQRAVEAKVETLAAMRELHAATVAREEEAARQEAQRVENERLAVELAAERERVAAAAAEVKRQAEDLQRKINEQAEREAKAERDAAAVLAAQRAESERLEALAEQQRAAAELAAEVAEHAELERERIADLTADAPKVGDDEPFADSYLPASAAAVPPPAEVLPMTLGQIKDRLGFDVSAAFLSSLGIEPVATVKRAIMYRAESFATICDALIAHISAAKGRA